MDNFLYRDSTGQNQMLRTSRTHLSRLNLLRAFGIAGAITAMVVAETVFDIALPNYSLGVVVTAITLVNAFTWLRLRYSSPVSDQEMLFHLVTDVAGLSALLYFSGGSTNPFVSLLLLPLIISATLLPARYSLFMSILTIACYSFLLFWFKPLVDGLHDAGHATEPDSLETRFRIHIVGMWFNFVVSAALISLVVVRMRESIHNRDQQLALAREETLRNERIIALGTLAAGAAHELGTPLSTISVVTKELLNEHRNDPSFVEDMKIVRTQVEQCKRTLSELLASAGTTRPIGGTIVPLDKHVKQTIDKWLLVRPNVAIQTSFSGETAIPDVMIDQTLDQAMMNLLNNAADVSPEYIKVDCFWDTQHIVFTILDRGPGLSEEALRNVGKAFFSTKTPDKGLGIGLVLANATIERFGGTVRWYNHEEGGAVTEVTLPLNKLRSTNA
jgi:two-component system sensor histidine kinase RegB